jgi:putative membrane protein
MNEFIPYCGLAPIPGDLKWNTDPILISCLIMIALLYTQGARSPSGPNRAECTFFACGWACAALALISPLCNLSVALFSARVTQHMILALVAAPLLVLGRPDRIVSALAPKFGAGSPLRFNRRRLLVAATIAFAVCIWFWHIPGPYNATLQNNVVYWLMHVSTFAAAMLLWYGLIHGGIDEPGPALVAGFLTAMQMSLLGAILTFAARPLFSVHSVTTLPWHLSQMDDQQLGGLIMWVPGGLLFLIYAMIAFAALLRGMERAAQELPSAR